ncbi:hypothetical protein F8388_025068 [Cannabis sativa]|uniref:Reverse transcriptase zinc-binding domain-containing protein n=1 Tax=Cannabis sativa TaxID=3483 RepID=A0A7J6FLE0_CANSA|nr:hypothetical protein F8388_025068 [Cannabis sativa]
MATIENEQVEKGQKQGSMQGIGAVNSEWMTPKRKGMKIANVVETRAIENFKNGYEVLQETIDGNSDPPISITFNGVGLGALFETKVKHDKVKEMVENNFPNWEFYSSHLISGRILILWQSKFVQVEILHEDAQLIHCKIKVCGHKDIFLVTAVYGSNSKEERKALWTKLSSIGHPNLPWVILGDFNAMFSYEDRNGGRQIQAKDIEDAQDWLAMGQVEEFKCSGSYFTWSNKHEIGDLIFSKLDRMFVNKLWMDVFMDTDAIFKWDNVSDHSFCLIRNQKKSNVGFKPFRFCNFWADHSNYKQRVLEAWETPTDRRGLEGIMQKLHRVRQSLIQFMEAQEVKYSRAIWNKLIIPKHRFILWQACNVQLLTRDHLSKFLIIPSILCPVCENDIETHTHLFFDCVFARKTFVEIGKWLGVVDWPKEAEQIQQWCTRGPLDFKNRVINSVFAASLYLLWKNRNRCIFDLVCSSPLNLSIEIRKLSHYRILSLTCNTSKKQDKYIIDVIRGW